MLPQRYGIVVRGMLQRTLSRTGVFMPRQHRRTGTGSLRALSSYEARNEDNVEVTLSKNLQRGRRRLQRAQSSNQALMTFRSMKEFLQAKRTVQVSNLRNAVQSHGYELEELLGKGQFGRVFLATESVSSTLKAIKVLDVSTSRREYNWTWLTREERDSATKDMDLICVTIDSLPSGVVKEHFTQSYAMLREKLKAEENPQRRKTRRPVAEREILLHISPNPFVSNLETSFFEGSNLFMVFNYYPGGTLQDLLNAQPEQKLDPETARLYASELVIALEFLRDNNIAHRDIKPENMLLDEQGHIALSDFGLATRLQGGLKTFCGTAEYVAPEVLSEVTWKSTYLDWWAFGVTLYQMLSGRTPFGGSKDAATVFLNTLTAPLVFPPDFPEDARSLLEGILNRDYSKRILPEDVRKHPYFANIEFNELKKKLFPAPVTPAPRVKRANRPKSARRHRPRIEVSFDFV